jgi:hypothetical protein
VSEAKFQVPDVPEFRVEDNHAVRVFFFNLELWNLVLWNV